MARLKRLVWGRVDLGRCARVLISGVVRCVVGRGLDVWRIGWWGLSVPMRKAVKQGPRSPPGSTVHGIRAYLWSSMEAAISGCLQWNFLFSLISWWRSTGVWLFGSCHPGG